MKRLLVDYAHFGIIREFLFLFEVDDSDECGWAPGISVPETDPAQSPNKLLRSMGTVSTVP